MPLGVTVVAKLGARAAAAEMMGGNQLGHAVAVLETIGELMHGKAAPVALCPARELPWAGQDLVVGAAAGAASQAAVDRMEGDVDSTPNVPSVAELGVTRRPAVAEVAMNGRDAPHAAAFAIAVTLPDASCRVRVTVLVRLAGSAMGLDAFANCLLEMLANALVTFVALVF